MGTEEAGFIRKRSKQVDGVATTLTKTEQKHIENRTY